MKKAKKKTAKKTTKRKSPVRVKKEIDPAVVRKKVSQMVKSSASKMANAVISQAENVAQLASVKYMFEMANIFPAEKEEDRTSENEDCLAQTLLRRLDLPDEPIARDEDDEGVKVAVPVKPVDGKGESEESSEQKSVEEKEEAVLV